MPNASLDTGWTAGTGEQRAQDINAAFADPDVDVIIAAIGGNHSAQTLAHLDFDLIRENPKIFQGYSDVTVLLWALAAKARMQTFHGPALIPELGEYPEVLAYTDRWMQKAWTGEPITFEPAKEWTDEFLDWDEKRDLERPRHLRRGDGWHCVRPGTAEGPLIGGCLETIIWHINGTDLWSIPDGALLFLETSEEAPSPAQVDAYLTTIERQGVFDAIGGLIFGRSYGYNEDAEALLYSVLAARTDKSGIPVITDVDIGHTDPMLTLPIGRMARVDTAERSFSLL